MYRKLWCLNIFKDLLKIFHYLKNFVEYPEGDYKPLECGCLSMKQSSQTEFWGGSWVWNFCQGFSYLQFWVWCPQPLGCLLLSLEEHLPKLPAPGCSCILLPDSVPLTKLMLTWWLQCWHVLGKPECCAGDEKSTLPLHGQNVGEGPAASPSGQAQVYCQSSGLGRVSFRTEFESMIRFPKKGICRTGHQSVLHYSNSFCLLIWQKELYTFF